MANLTVTAADAALKQLYPPNQIKYLGYQDNPFLAMVKKDENFGGNVKKMPMWYGGNQGRSRVFATAQANKTAGKYSAFLLTRVKDYGLSSIDLEAILASAQDEYAFLSMAKSELDNTLRQVSRNIGISLYRNSGGARGQIASISSTTFTLSNPDDIVNFEVGMNIVQSTADGTSGSLGSGDTTISSVNRRAGTFVVASASNFTANDYLFVKGDFGVSISGLQSWLPATAPTGGDSFFGVDRSTDARLYGQYYDGSTVTISEALLKMDAYIAREGGKASHCFMNPMDMNKLRVQHGSQIMFDTCKSSDLDISFTTIRLNGLKGPINVIGDANCPVNRAFVLDLSTWELCSIGGAPRILTRALEGANGTKFIWDASSDSVEIRTGMYGNLGCYAPVWNGQVKLA